MVALGGGAVSYESGTPVCNNVCMQCRDTECRIEVDAGIAEVQPTFGSRNSLVSAVTALIPTTLAGIIVGNRHLP